MKNDLCPDMPVMVNDWLSSTAIAQMTTAEAGGFFFLLCHAWNDPDCCLPNTTSVLAKLSRLRKGWHRSKGIILAQFEPHETRHGFIFNPKQRAMREKQHARIQSSRDQHREAANARWSRNRDAGAMRSHDPTDAGVSNPHMRQNASSPVSRLPSLNKASLNGAVLVNRALLDLISDCGEVFGKTEMERPDCHRRWMERASHEPDKLRRVLADVRATLREQAIDNPAAYAETLWKVFTFTG